MVDVARVNLYGQPIGSARWNQRYEVAQFEYDPDFVRHGIEPSPLMMPVREGRIYSFGELDKTTFKGLPGMLADSLPDTYGRALFEKWLALTGRTSGNAIETLCFLGKRCMGALEFEPAIDTVDTNIRIEVDSLVNVAREALADKSSFNVNIDSDKKAAIAEILRLGTSAGGQRAKAIIAYNKATGDVPQNGIQCRGTQPGRPHEEHLVPDGQRREMAALTCLRHGLRLQSRRPVDLYPPDVDKRQIQRHHQRRPVRMCGQEQYQEFRTDYRRGLPGGIQVAGDCPGMRSAAKDD